MSFTNNCPDPWCEYHSKLGSVELTLKHNISWVSGELKLDFTQFRPESLMYGEGEDLCPTLKEFGVLKGQIDNAYQTGTQSFALKDQFGNNWYFEFDGQKIWGVVNSDDPGCMGIRSDNIEFSRK